MRSAARSPSRSQADNRTKSTSCWTAATTTTTASTPTFPSPSRTPCRSSRCKRRALQPSTACTPAAPSTSSPSPAAIGSMAEPLSSSATTTPTRAIALRAWWTRLSATSMALTLAGPSGTTGFSFSADTRGPRCASHRATPRSFRPVRSWQVTGRRIFRLCRMPVPRKRAPSARLLP